MKRRNLPYRKSIRLKGWDYRNPGLYFITICAGDRQHHFGEIRNGIMGLSVPGCIAWHFWRQIPDHQPQVVLDQCVVMPNHVHGIVGIVGAGQGSEAGQPSVGTCHGMSLRMGNHATGQQEQAQFGKPQAKSLSMIVNHFKGAVTLWCRRNEHSYFAWQPRFYDHIIRNDQSLQRIREYIFDNPLQWPTDRNHPGRVHEQAVEYMAAI